MSTKKNPSPNPSTESRKPAQDQAKTLDETRDFDDLVNEASDESFPASDPPAWTDTAASKDGN